jgi:phage terminase large subunit-like protein
MREVVNAVADKVTRKPLDPVELKSNYINGKRVGNQIPGINVIPMHESTDRGDEAIEFLNLVGIELDPWQAHILRAACNMDSRQKWAATEVGLVVPRQCGKTVIAELRELVGLFLFGEQVQIHSAQLFSTAKESFLRQVARIRKCPDLMETVHKFRTGNDNVSIELKNGSRLMYQARGNDPSRGFSADLVVYDEAYGLTAEVIAASMMTLSARPNPQLWYCSSTGMEDSEFLYRVRERGLDRAPRLAFFEFSASPGCDPKDKEEWYRAIPALGIRIEEEFIESEGQALDWGKQFRRERLGLWADTSMRDVIEEEWWVDCANEGSEISGEEIVAAVDISPWRDRASVSICGITEDGRRQLEVIYTAKGTDWVVDYIKKLYMSTQPPVKVAIQGGGAPGSMIAPLQREGVDLIILGQTEIGRATGEFHDSVRDGMIVHLNDPIVNAALANSTRYNIGSREGSSESPTWGFSRKNTSGADITPIVSACFAHYGMSKFLAERGIEEAKKPTLAHMNAPIGGRIW